MQVFTQVMGLLISKGVLQQDAPRAIGEHASSSSVTRRGVHTRFGLFDPNQLALTYFFTSFQEKNSKLLHCAAFTWFGTTSVERAQIFVVRHGCLLRKLLVIL
jgi:hypothetical protein